jgi:cell pole-organizing protein PopZ
MEASQPAFEVSPPADIPATRDADILELTQPVEPARAPGFTAVHGADVAFREEERRGRPAPTPKPAPAKPAPAPAAAMPVRDDELLSAQSTAAVSAAFHTLSAAVLTENARTLEDIVKEMMRPMLKAWLDENLPGLVERMVRSEIERVARGSR